MMVVWNRVDEKKVSARTQLFAKTNDVLAKSVSINSSTRYKSNVHVSNCQ